MEYAGNVTHIEIMNSNNTILHAYKAGGKLYGYKVFAKSQFFPTTKEYVLFNYHGS